jgi:hypothetical protein
MKQEVKTVENGEEYFFFPHSFKSALDHALENVKKNRHKDIDVYLLNQSPYLFKRKDGTTNQWLFYKSFKKRP